MIISVKMCSCFYYLLLSACFPFLPIPSAFPQSCEREQLDDGVPHKKSDISYLYMDLSQNAGYLKTASCSKRTLLSFFHFFPIACWGGVHGFPIEKSDTNITKPPFEAPEMSRLRLYWRFYGRRGGKLLMPREWGNDP